MTTPATIPGRPSHHPLGVLAAAPAVHLLPTTGAERVVKSWVVQLGRDLYVRTAPGAGWPRGGPARVRLDGAEHPVLLSEVAPELHGPLDDAYRAKYDRYGQAKVDAVLSDGATASTYRLRARRLPWWERVAGAVDAVRRRGATPPAPRAEAPCPTC